MTKQDKVQNEFKQVLLIIWKFVIVPGLYALLMWASLIAAAFLVLGDLWQAAGFVSAITLYFITQAEFKKEFFGARNYGIQEQKKR